MGWAGVHHAWLPCTLPPSWLLAGTQHGMASQMWVMMGFVPPPPPQIRSVTGYVAQDDVLPGTLSTLEYLAFNALLRMPPHK